MIIRPAADEERALCAALYEVAARETFTWWPAEAITAERFLVDADGEVMHLALEDDRLLGFASVWTPDRFLHSLYVAREARGGGVGAALLDHARALVGGDLSLKVQKLNARAIAFYRRHGLEIVEAGGEADPGGGWFRMRDVIV